MHNVYRLLIVSAFILEARLCLADTPVRCTSDQSFCEIDNFRLTIGDQVGFFNDSQKLIATGEVQRLKGVLRVVKINKRLAEIVASSTVRPIGDDVVGSRGEVLEYFQPEARLQLYGGAGLANSSLSSDSRGYLAEAKIDYLSYFGIRPGATARFALSNGSIVDTRQGDLSRDYKVSSTELYLTASQIFWRQNSISLRPEIGLGGAFVSYSLSGDGPSPNSFSKLNEGLNLALTGGLSCLWKTPWALSTYADFSYRSITKVSGLSISLGMMHSL